jgi:hypothetical protein
MPGLLVVPIPIDLKRLGVLFPGNFVCRRPPRIPIASCYPPGAWFYLRCYPSS